MRSGDPLQHFNDMLDNIHRIEVYTKNLDYKAYVVDLRTVDAVERCLARISEAAVRLGNSGPEFAPDVPWHDVRGIGNHLRHAYETINQSTIWQVVIRDLPNLKIACVNAILKLKNDR